MGADHDGEDGGDATERRGADARVLDDVQQLGVQPQVTHQLQVSQLLATTPKSPFSTQRVLK